MQGIKIQKTIYLDPDALEKLRAMSKRSRLTETAVVRAAVRALYELAQTEPSAPRAYYLAFEVPKS